ncbi:uncharacterized protein EV420DRAFT_1623663 [Desarmillaria tabescens]|uniref:DUF6570 domain-containing protein n=1 Tax=Armillaria tabescens TaxID=1929756 RepID=A0AA39MHJ0_ARMTA|nr:uncharacterized protein EV420DRAFT_1623663 [Desarmillaria tabescens]KAK0435106.1 hypothetical protein EV420DRAFT_1623663 [Desarmillaria tabescens]
MVALCRTKCMVVQLKDDSDTQSKKHLRQRGTVGHMIVYPQCPGAIAEMLPPSLEDITSPVCVIFVGAHLPSKEWLHDKAKPLWVCGKRVLQQLDQNPVLPIHIQHVIPSKATLESTSRYDNIDLDEFQVQEDESESNTVLPDKEVPFQNVVISDVDGDASYADLKLAAFNHVKKNGQGYIRIPHDPEPCNEFNNPALLPMMYPSLFPYGVGGLEDSARTRLVSFERASFLPFFRF